MNSDAKSLLWNVAGGIIVAILTSIYVHLRYALQAYHLQRLVGFRFKRHERVRIIYAHLLFPPLNVGGRLISHPFVKPHRTGGALPVKEHIQSSIRSVNAKSALPLTSLHCSV